jgi:hypothetical protein
MPLSHDDISRMMRDLLVQADEPGRAHILGLAMAAMLDHAGPPAEQHRMLERMKTWPASPAAYAGRAGSAR